MGFSPLTTNEVPHVRALPIPLAVPPGSIVVREWPNIAGRLEPARDGDVVRWCRSLAPEPPQGTVVARGEPAEPGLVVEMRQWLLKFARRLMQMPGVSIAASPDTPRIILLTPHGLKNEADRPEGIDRVPERLAEFPGGLVLTMDERTFEDRTEYADAVEFAISKG
jgi:hypothetical protein